jgi:hypothetical protein
MAWEPKTVYVSKVKLVYGWHSLKKRDELFEHCLNATFLLVEHYDEINSTYQDFFTVIFKERQKLGLLNLVQWNGNNPLARPLEELMFVA